MTRPRQRSPLGRYSIWNAVSSSRAGASSRSARTRTRWSPLPLPASETMPRVLPARRWMLPVSWSEKLAAFHGFTCVLNGPADSTSSRPAAAAPASAGTYPICAPARTRGWPTPQPVMPITAPAPTPRERTQPRAMAVGAPGNPVPRPPYPKGEGRVVRAPPGGVRKDAAAQPVRDRDRQHQLGGDDPESHPRGPVPRDEWDHERLQGKRQVAVDRDGDDVDDDERAGRECREAMHVLDRDARPQLHAAPAGHLEPQQDDRRQKHERHDAAGARGVPRHGAARQMHAASATRPFQQRLTNVDPSARRKRPGIPRASSQSGPASPIRNAALA